ncbi:hypothetical protein PybrP1_012801 [[Pythium] brassicae (nom. inval.)]|nr:hypothetical protein PybrP1_012801 [[Pythium] brassicae (nom. inval.)]
MTRRPAPAASAATSLCSVRDAEQGVYEYLAETHEPATPLALRAFAVPVRLSGWLWRREGLFRRARRRFCVFDAASATLAVFASDGPPAQRRQLARFVVTHVALADRAFHVQGYLRTREIHRGHASALARRRASLPALPGDQQHFFLPETEMLRAVSDTSLRVWRHCFRSHMKGPARLRRLRRRWRRLQPGDSSGDSSGDSADDSGDDDDDDAYGNPDFQFDEPAREPPLRRGAGGRVRRRHVRGRGDNDDDGDTDDDGDARLMFDQESALRITASYHALPSTTFFESRAREPDSVAGVAWRDDDDANAHPAQYATTATAATTTASRPQHQLPFDDLVQSGASSIWADDALLSYRVDFDAVAKQRRLATGAFGEVWLALYRGVQRRAVPRRRARARVPVRRS